MREEFTDPLNATSAAISRKGFAVFGSAALAGLAAGTAAAQGQDQLGKPHPPFVAEDDPAIIVSRPQLRPVTGGPIQAYAAVPRGFRPGTAGVVVVQQIWGVDAQIRDVVRRFAKAGYVTAAPLLFSRVNAPDGDGATDIAPFAAAAERMTQQGFVSTDIDAAHDWTVEQSAQAKTGIVGFCMGGGITLEQIIGSTIYGAAAMFYGSVRPGTASDAPTTVSTFDFTKQITTPLLGSFGARDTSIKPDDVREMFSQLTAPHDVKIYAEAGHAFFDDTRPRYVPGAASDAWSRTIAWFQKYLTQVP